MASKPTSRQINYLKALARQTGTSFTYPATRGEASREIERMRSVLGHTDTRAERISARVEHRDISSSCAAGTSATAIRSDEITGYGSSAAWA